MLETNKVILSFFELATSFMIVACVSPLQNAGIVDMIKSCTGDITLAIGDGELQWLSISVGIWGRTHPHKTSL